MSEIPLNESAFRGLNASIPPDRLPPGFLQTADNCVVEDAFGGEGGIIKSRPGKRGILTSATGNEIGASIEYHASDGTEYLLFVAGGTSGGTVGAQLYLWTKDATTVSAVSSSNVFDRTKVQFCRLGSWVYIVGGDNSNAGKLYRWNPSVGFGEASGLTTPAKAMAVTAVNTVVDTLADPTDWTAESAATIFSGYDADFTDSSDGNPPSVTYWDTGGSPIVEDNIDPVNVGDLYARLSDPGDFVQTANPLVPSAKTGSNFPLHYWVTTQYRTNNGDEDSVELTVIAYNAAHQELTRISKIVQSSVTGSIVRNTYVFSFADTISETEIAEIKIKMTAGPQNAGGTAGPWIRAIASSSYLPTATFSTDGSKVTVGITYSDVLAFGLQDKTAAFVGQQRFSCTLAASTSFAAYDYLAVPVSKPSNVENFNIRLGLVGSGSAYTDVGSYLEDENGSGYLLFDLTTITGASKAGITSVVFQPINDFPLTSGEIEGSFRVFSLGGLVAVGNLSVGEGQQPYAYLYRERNASNITSKATALSATITPTRIRATGKVVFTTSGGGWPATASATIEVYRTGGSLTGPPRKVAEFTTSGNASGTYFSWDNSTGTLIESTPDTYLDLQNEILTDHDAYPFGSSNAALACGVYDSRLAIATAKGIYLSQLTTEDAAKGLYWDLVANPTRGDAVLQGWFRPLTANDGASIGNDPLRLVPFAGRLMALFGSSVFSLTGESVNDFKFTREQILEGLGIIAQRAVEVFGGRLFFLTASGVYSFDVGDILTDRGNARLESGPIEKLLNPKASFSGAALNPAGYRAAWLKSHAGRLYLGVPTASSGANIGAVFVLDLRAGGVWTRWLLSGATGAAAFRSNDDSDDLYMTDSAGQISSFGNAYGDKATPASSTVAVQMVVETRDFADYNGRNELYAQRFGAWLECADATPSVTITVEGDSATSQQWQQAYAWTAGEVEIRRLKVASRVRGRRLSAKIDGTTTEALIVRRITIVASAGRLSV